MLLTLTTWLTPTRTSEELMLQYQETGKARFLKELVEQHYDDLLHFLISQSNTHLAADITQKTWLKVMEKRHYYQSHNKFKAWLFTIARRLLIDEIRKSIPELPQQIRERISNRYNLNNNQIDYLVLHFLEYVYLANQNPFLCLLH